MKILLKACKDDYSEDSSLECFDEDEAFEYLSKGRFELFLVTNYIAFDEIE